jgi:hypothetical protein
LAAVAISAILWAADALVCPDVFYNITILPIRAVVNNKIGIKQERLKYVTLRCDN